MNTVIGQKEAEFFVFDIRRGWSHINEQSNIILPESSYAYANNMIRNTPILISDRMFIYQSPFAYVRGKRKKK